MAGSILKNILQSPINNKFFNRGYAHKLILVCISSITYTPVIFLNFEYTSDDNWMLLNNSYVWNEDIGFVLSNISTTFDYGQYSPLNTLMYRAIYYCFGMNPTAFHSVSLLLHIINVQLVYAFITEICQVLRSDDSLKTSFFSTLFYAVLPVHAETLSWIAASKILGCTIFMLLSVIFYLKLEKSTKRTIICYLLFVLSYGFKEQAIILPILFILIDYTKGIELKNSIKENTCFLLFSILGFYWSYIGSKTISYIAPDNLQLGIYKYVGLPIYCIFRYVYNLFLPFSLQIRYNSPGIETYYTLLALIMILVSLSFWFRSKIPSVAPLVKFGFLFFFLSILCFINIIPLPRPSIMADRYLYFASIGLAMVVGSFYKDILKSRYSIAFFTCYIIALMSISFTRCLNWSFLDAF